MIGPEVDQAKQAARERVWTLLDDAGVSPPPGAHGRIPNVVGADQAAQRLSQVDEWHRSRVIKANPDRAPHPIRVHALRDGKLLYMAVPKLATAKLFYLLDPTAITEPFEMVTTGEGAAKHAPTIDVEHMRHVDLIVVAGSAAVNLVHAACQESGSASNGSKARSAAPSKAASSPKAGVRSRTCSRAAGRPMLLRRLRTWAADAR